MLVVKDLRLLWIFGYIVSFLLVSCRMFGWWINSEMFRYVLSVLICWLIVVGVICNLVVVSLKLSWWVVVLKVWKVDSGGR